MEMGWSKLVSTRRSTVLSLLLQRDFPVMSFQIYSTITVEAVTTSQRRPRPTPAGILQPTATRTSSRTVRARRDESRRRDARDEVEGLCSVALPPRQPRGECSMLSRSDRAGLVGLLLDFLCREELNSGRWRILLWDISGPGIKCAGFLEFQVLRAVFWGPSSGLQLFSSRFWSPDFWVLGFPNSWFLGFEFWLRRLQV